jgi:hypothetical protein
MGLDSEITRSNNIDTMMESGTLRYLRGDRNRHYAALKLQIFRSVSAQIVFAI